VTESSEVLPVAIALLSEHVHECIETLMNKRPSIVERPGRCPAQYSGQRDRSAIGAAAAARLLQPLICIQLPRSSHRIAVTDRTTIMEARNRNGGSNRRAQPEWYFARVDVARIRLAVLEVCALAPLAVAQRHVKNFRGHVT